MLTISQTFALSLVNDVKRPDKVSCFTVEVSALDCHSGYRCFFQRADGMELRGYLIPRKGYAHRADSNVSGH